MITRRQLRRLYHAAVGEHGLAHESRGRRFEQGRPAPLRPSARRSIGHRCTDHRAEAWRNPRSIHRDREPQRRCRHDCGRVRRQGAGGRRHAADLLHGKPRARRVMVRDLAYDPIRDLAMVARVAGIPAVLAVGHWIPATSMRELVDYAKSRPGVLTAAPSGVGSSSGFALELLKAAAGIDILQVAYGGLAPAVNGLLSRQMDMVFTDLAIVAPHAKNGSACSGRRPARASPPCPIYRRCRSRACPMSFSMRGSASWRPQAFPLRWLAILRVRSPKPLGRPMCGSDCSTVDSNQSTTHLRNSRLRSGATSVGSWPSLRDWGLARRTRNRRTRRVLR